MALRDSGSGAGITHLRPTDPVVLESLIASALPAPHVSSANASRVHLSGTALRAGALRAHSGSSEVPASSLWK